MEHLRTENLQPRNLHNMALTELLETLDKMNDPVFSPSQQRPQCGYRWHPEPKYRASRSYQIDLIKAKGGLCIDCISCSATSTVHFCESKH